MCGIVGLFAKEATGDLEARASGGIQRLRHRGPDDCGRETFDLAGGCVVLGHTRLSIIDLSHAGHQPMHSADGRYALVFNGEIYNYKELRRELTGLGCVFRTNTDTEVLLAAWARWGQSSLTRFEGMFAFAVLDRETLTLTCVRDAFGIKPLYFSSGADGFLFASEISAIKALGRQSFGLDWQQAYEYLAFGSYDDGTRTFLDGVSQLLPGHAVTLDLRSGVLSGPSRWWMPDIVERSDLSFAQAVEQVRETFLTSVRLHLRSDVPLGIALSGGIDSSAVACAVRHLEPDLPIRTFSYIARGTPVSEETWVDQVNGHVQATPHKVTVSADDLASDLDDMIRCQGEPFGSTSIYAQYRVFRLAREQGVTVTLDGQGADEMLAGYVGYPGQRIRSLVETGHVVQALRFLNEWSKWPGRSRLLGAKYAASEMTGGRAYRFLRRVGGYDRARSWINYVPLEERGIACRFRQQRPEHGLSGRRVASELAFALTRRGLPALLRHGDRNSMRFSVESRVPFLTPNLVELMLSLPESYLISAGGETKHVFRVAMRGIVPDAVLDRRDKIGFQTPEHAWLMSMAAQIRKWLRVDLGLPFLDQAAILREFDEVVAGRRGFSWQVWRWINFFRWYETVFTS